MEMLKAIRNNDCRKVEKLLKKGFNVNQEIDEYEKKALICRTIPICAAAARGYAKVVELLLSYGANINAANSYWSSAMHTASFHGYTNVINVLLQRNVDLGNQDVHGNTALQVAVLRSHFEAVTLLLTHNISIDSTNKQGQTALDIAQEHGATYLENLLIEKQKKQIIAPQPARRPSSNSKKSNESFDNDTTLNEKDKLLRQLQELELKEANDSIKEKQEKLSIVTDEIRQFDEEGAKLTNQLSSIQKKITENNQALVAKGALKRILEQELQKLETKRTGTLQNENKVEQRSFECPICFVLPLPPKHIFQCTNGHVYCSDCKGKPQMTNCPQCRIPLNTSVRNIILEEIIANIFIET